MNKTLKLILCLALVLCTVASFAACGGDGDISGTYYLSGMKMGDMVVEGEAMEAALSASGYSADDMYIKLEKDGTGYMYVMGQEADMKYEDGEIWPVEEPNSKVEYDVDGDELTLTIQGIEMTFEK